MNRIWSGWRRIAISVLVFFIVATVYANIVGHYARQALFRGFVAELDGMECEIRNIDYEKRTIKVLDFSKSTLSAPALTYQLVKFRGYQAETLVVPASWNTNDIEILREKTSQMISAVTTEDEQQFHATKN